VELMDRVIPIVKTTEWPKEMKLLYVPGTGCVPEVHLCGRLV
jgi:hypothetical protein